MVRVLCAGPAAVRALVDGREGVVELDLASGAYVRLGADYVFLGEPGLPFGPLSIAVAGIERLDVRPGLEVRVVGKSLVLGSDVIGCERMRERRPPEVGPVVVGPPTVELARRAAAAELPVPPARLRAGIAAFAAARIDDAVRLLAGVGDGLTPAGDDVLAGYAAARALPLSALAAGRSSPLGLAYLRSAERGELPDVGARLLCAIRRGSPALARDAVAGLTKWGRSSGLALGWGVTAALGPAKP